jgi:hypothetical protein
MNYEDMLIGQFFPNPLVEGKTYLSVSLPGKGAIQFDFLNEKDESMHRELWQPQPWGDTRAFDLVHLPPGNYEVQLKIEKKVVTLWLAIEKPKVKPLKKVKSLLASVLPEWVVLFVALPVRSET